jgi:glycosyltransferase involved in cell wall biosynthesis
MNSLELKLQLRGLAELRLAVVSPFLDREHGTELCIVEQVERLAQKDGWEIHLYSQNVRQIEGVEVFSDVSRETGAGIYWHQIPKMPGPQLFAYVWWFFANDARRWLDRRSGKFSPDLVYSPGVNCVDADVIVVHIVFSEFYRLMRSELLLKQSPLRSWPLLIHRRLYYKLIISLERRYYRNGRASLIAVSALVANQLKEHFEREDVTVIPNSVDTLRFNAAVRNSKRELSRQVLGYSHADFILLFIGNDWKKKGLAALLVAMAKLHDMPVRLLVVGKDDRHAFLPILEQMDLKKRVRFEKPSADVLSFYAAADLYIAPALEDAFGLPILDAMACGLAVIASVNAGASESIREGETGLLLQNPRDASEIAGCIRRLYQDDALREKIAFAAAEYALKNCSWELNADRTRQILEAVFNRNSKS